MNHPRRIGLVDLALALVIFAAAVGVRAWYLYSLASSGASVGPLAVQDGIVPGPTAAGDERRGQADRSELDVLVENLTQQRGFTAHAPLASGEEQTAHLAPGYPTLLALLKRAPIDLSPIDQTARWIQCGLGGLTAALYTLFARRAFGHRLVSLLTGIFCAVSPFWIVSTAEVSDGVVVSFLLGLALFLGSRAGQAGGAFTSLLYGGTLAGLALIRATCLPFAGVALLWYLVRCRSLRRGWLAATLAFLGFVTTLSPWTVRNYQLFHDMLPIADSAYYHLWMGNSPGATGGPRSEPELIQTLAMARGEEPAALEERLASMEQPARYRDLARATVREIRTAPAATLQRRLWAGLAFLFGESWLTQRVLYQGELGPEQGPSWLRRSYPAIFAGCLLAMLTLGLLGWRWTAGWSFEAMPSSLALVWIPLPYVLSHAEWLHGPRLPLDGVLLSYSAFAVVCLIVPSARRTLLAGGTAETDEEVESSH